ncbi:uncharacterized protein LOC130441733 [Diorhabda sublineata]|uniref:uncharacterized protein LOC130441733 n=1 Tax=Diorhabda sublineata TaxID=1163346 RepID=UPI0024E06071|nr:uncharacterized protein LOC130441733 [Diorhabda sublineata]
MSLGHAKMDVYSIVDPETNFVYDKLILDHNRMLGEKTLEETIENDLEWFETLDDYQQINLTLGLIRISGGNVKRNLYIPLYRIYIKSICELHCKQFPKSGKSTVVLEEPPQENSQIYDPKHPDTIEVEKQRKKWFDLIQKYKQEVMQETSKKKNKDKKKTKEKKKKATKSSKKEKDKGKDLIQLLPIWIVKKIFGYIDTKILVKLKQVNSYWAFVISELIKEKNARQKLDAALDKMKAAMDPEVFERAEQQPEEQQSKPIGKKVFYELGAIDKKIVPKNLKGLVDAGIDTDAAKARVDEYNMITGEWVHFPRFIKEDLELYRFRPGFLQDVGVEFDIVNEIERQKSFLTYSLSKSVCSLKISIKPEMLDEW